MLLFNRTILLGVKGLMFILLVLVFFPQVWDSNSGHELFTFEGGTNSAVTYCCFKPSGGSIVGVSDTFVKVYWMFYIKKISWLDFGSK